MELYPLKFNPIFKERIWGGNKLNNVFNKNFPNGNIGESWEVSDVEKSISVVSEGSLKGKSLRKILKEYKGHLVGDKVYNKFKNEFPILIKFIDAKKPLSIQVHPNNELAKERHNSFGKNEMWYIMDADNDSEIIVGFNKNISKKDYLKSLSEGSILNELNAEKISAGDTFYIPTGRVHAIGAGTIIAEIQQTSDITYRIYDYDRIDSATGLPRELHTDLALDAIDYSFSGSYKTEYNLNSDKPSKLVHSQYFKTDIIQVDKDLNIDFSELDSFIVLIGVDGNSEIKYKGRNYNLMKGETIFLPATTEEINIHSTSKSSKIISVYY